LFLTVCCTGVEGCTGTLIEACSCHSERCRKIMRKIIELLQSSFFVFLLKESFRASKVYSLMSKDGLQSPYGCCPKSGPLGPDLNQVQYLSHACLCKVSGVKTCNIIFMYVVYKSRPDLHHTKCPEKSATTTAMLPLQQLVFLERTYVLAKGRFLHFYIQHTHTHIQRREGLAIAPNTLGWMGAKI